MTDQSLLEKMKAATDAAEHAVSSNDFVRTAFYVGILTAMVERALADAAAPEKGDA